MMRRAPFSPPPEKQPDQSVTSPARMVSRYERNVLLEDVAGVPEARQVVSLIASFVRNPKHYRQAGAYLPQSVLFTGPSGCGKTFLIQSLVTGAHVPALLASGSAFVSPEPGAGAARLR